jgi:assimilatory nitrate reductase catalytic subunit
VRDALGRLELFVVSENVTANDTVAAGAHILLPAAAWGEKDGTVTNSERRISRQRAFLPAPGDVKPDWWMVTQVARRMGFTPAFPYRSAADIFREHAALSAFENGGRRDFDLGGLADIGDDAFAALDPVQWPLRAGETRRKRQPDRRFFAEGGFYTPDRKARFVAPEPPAPSVPTGKDFPFRLNTGRVRDQWHTMTRSGLSPRLGAHAPEPFVEVHPADAAANNLVDGGFAQLTTRWGSCVLKVSVSAAQRRGSLFAPIHWSDATASAARIGDLVMPETDRYSGQPDAKATPTAIAAVAFAFRGFAVTRRPLALPAGTWWARVALAQAFGLLLASNDGCLFIGPAEAAPQWDAVKALFEAATLDDAARRVLLSGCSADGLASAGPIVCACFGVGLTTIRDAFHSGAATSVEGIGATLRAGTNCGSCLPELKRIVADAVGGMAAAATSSQVALTSPDRARDPAAMS